MQFKLLQTYRVLSNFSTSLIMEFVPFIILNLAKNQYGFDVSLSLMFLYWGTLCLFSMTFCYCFKKLYFKYPQLFLLIRLVPIVCSQILIMFLNINNLWLLALIAFFNGMEYGFNFVPTEIIYNYVSEGKDEKTLAMTRFLSQMGWLSAGIIGGIFLDNLDKTIIVLISLVIYLTSVIPLVVFYFKSRKEKFFNVDYISETAQKEEKFEKLKKIKKEFIKKHFISYFFIGPLIYPLYYLATAHIYISSGSFFVTGIVNAIFDGLYGLGCIFVGKYASKKDGKNISVLAGVLLILFMGISLISNNLIVIIVSFLVCSLLQPFIILHYYQSYLIKARIIGVANDIIVNQEVSSAGAYSICYFSGCFGGGLIAPLIVCSVLAIVGIFYSRRSDDETTKILVDYLSENE